MPRSPGRSVEAVAVMDGSGSTPFKDVLSCLAARHWESTALPESVLEPNIRAGRRRDVPVVSEILTEAARWLQDTGRPLWSLDEVSPDQVREDMISHLFLIAEIDGEPAGTMRFQLEDSRTWPDVPEDQSTYIHRLAVRRKFAGGDVSSALVDWAIDRTRELGRRYLRLDCESDRPRLREVYEDLGFTHHSDRQVGPFHVARYEYQVG